MLPRLLLTIILGFCLSLSATAGEDTLTLAPGYGGLGYKLPEPSSYDLATIRSAPDAEVIDSRGQTQQLHDLFKGKISLLAFIYTQCSDINGCPLTSYVFYMVKQAMEREPILAKNLRLISFSFDPERDTPETLRLYAANFNDDANTSEWQFVTVASKDQLNGVLDQYGQDILSNGQQGDISHILRVFLIDASAQIRNIYSAAFLHTDLVLNDVRTLLLEPADETVRAVTTSTALTSGPGDDKQGYESNEYTTRSLSLERREGREMDLLALVQNPPLGLPVIPVPESNPITEAKIKLGRKLFYDRRLSLNDTFSCAMCHVPEQGFTSQEMQTAVGIEGRTVRRNTPTIYNVAYAKRLFHDGRESALEQQIWGPLLALNEMGNPSVGYIIDKIKVLPEYRDLFKAAFAGRGPDMETLGQALATYQRTLLSAASPFDRWFFGRDPDALEEQAKRGYELFTGKAGCVSCHRIEGDHALFTDHKLHNTGVGYRQSMQKDQAQRRILIAPGTFIDVDTTAIKTVSEQPQNDLGLYEITLNPSDRWKYRTPSLRNVALTAPYMHDGSIQSLRDVVRFYNEGGVPNELLSPLIRPLYLSETEIGELVHFLKSLTGDNVVSLVADAFAAPIGDVE